MNSLFILGVILDFAGTMIILITPIICENKKHTRLNLPGKIKFGWMSKSRWKQSLIPPLYRGIFLGALIFSIGVACTIIGGMGDKPPMTSENSELTYEQIAGEEFSGADGETNRIVYFPNAKEVYYSGMKLLKGEEWSNNGDYVILEIPLWGDQIIEIGYSFLTFR